MASCGGETLFEWEEGNAQDQYAVNLMKDCTIVGCVVRELSQCF